ncbi:MAG: hypothetical protein JW774_06665 [Candidatus Aureabacteria bacterium]|nr:hypothetical protein [Candidatus Auribacterota bacterium]
MTIRVTNSQQMGQVMSDINKNLRLLQELQLQISTGKRINQPSDDPIGVVKSVGLKSGIAATEQHQSNISDGTARLNAAILALSSTSDLLLEIEGLSADVVNNLTPQTSAMRPIVITEINQMINEIFINANAKYLGKYLFGGHESLTRPYIEATDAYGNITGVSRNVRGIDDPIMHTVAEGIGIQINVSGSMPFMPNGEGGQNDIFDSVLRLRDALTSGDMGAASDALDDLRDEFENINVAIAIAGNRLQQMETTESNNEELSIFKQMNLSDILDVDMARAIIDLNYQNYILQCSLEVGAKIIAPSLLDFI